MTKPYLLSQMKILRIIML